MRNVMRENYQNVARFGRICITHVRRAKQDEVRSMYACKTSATVKKTWHIALYLYYEKGMLHHVYFYLVYNVVHNDVDMETCRDCGAEY